MFKYSEKWGSRRGVGPQALNICALRVLRMLYIQQLGVIIVNEGAVGLLWGGKKKKKGLSYLQEGGY